VTTKSLDLLEHQFGHRPSTAASQGSPHVEPLQVEVLGLLPEPLASDASFAGLR